MLGVGSRSLWRRLQRKSFLIPLAHAVGSASQARWGLAGFCTILFPFLPHSTLKSVEGSCHGACKREHRGLRGGLKFSISPSLSSPTYFHSPTLCLFIWTLGYLLHPSDFPDPVSASSVWSCCCCLWCFQPLIILPFGRDTDLAMWRWLLRHCGHQKIVGVTGIWALAPHVSVGFLLAAAVSSHKGWPVLLLEVQTHVSKGNHLLTSQSPAMFHCAPLSLKRQSQEGHSQLRSSRRLINPRVYNIIILKFVFQNNFRLTKFLRNSPNDPCNLHPSSFLQVLIFYITRAQWPKWSNWCWHGLIIFKHLLYWALSVFLL